LKPSEFEGRENGLPEIFMRAAGLCIREHHTKNPIGSIQSIEDMLRKLVMLAENDALEVEHKTTSPERGFENT
jgi:hypothetical protein